MPSVREHDICALLLMYYSSALEEVFDGVLSSHDVSLEDDIHFVLVI
jgi:hypothetical protein